VKISPSPAVVKDYLRSPSFAKEGLFRPLASFFCQTHAKGGGEGYYKKFLDLWVIKYVLSIMNRY
jgi:hypothetical protein